MPVVSESPFVTVIVPSRPGQAEVIAVEAARRFDYPRDRIEILLARGRQPSAQRNTALRAAKGSLIYFLDDDAVAPAGQLRAAVSRFDDPAVMMLGGPNLCPADAPMLERVFDVVLGSWLAFSSSRARYDRVGKTRATSEKELILCNLMARKDVMLELGGFDESLYPNEENALMDAMQKRGGKLIYDPDFIVHRRPRPTLQAFCKMLMTYGRGRAEQFRLHPTLGSAPNFVPPLFCLYLVLVIVAFAATGTKFWPFFIPLAFYGLAVLGQTLVSIPTKGFARSLLALPLLVATHVFYGIGFWRGLFTKPSPPQRQVAAEIVIERLGLI